MAEYALVGTDGKVKSVIVADAGFISENGDSIRGQYGDASGTWVLTPAKVGIGYKSGNGMFITAPPDVTIVAPGAFTLSVYAAGATSYQWKKGTEDVNGATSATLIVDPSAVGDSGSYTCEISDGVHTLESDAATVTVTA